MVRSPDRYTQLFDIITCVIQGDTIFLFLFIIYLDFVLRKAIDHDKHLGLTIENERAVDILKPNYRLNSMNTIWKSNLKDKLNKTFFRAAVESVLVYGSYGL